MENNIKKNAILGIGNALVDVINVLEDDSLLDQFGLQRGSMTLLMKIFQKKYLKPLQTTNVK